MIQEQDSEEIEIIIFRERQYSLRGTADEEMLEKALSQVKDGEWYVIFSLENEFPNDINFLSSGNSYSEMRNDFFRLSGQEIGFGQDPFDIYDDEWFLKNHEKVFRLTVSKNQNYHESFVKNPEKYKWLEDRWQ